MIPINKKYHPLCSRIFLLASLVKIPVYVYNNHEPIFYIAWSLLAGLTIKVTTKDGKGKFQLNLIGERIVNTMVVTSCLVGAGVCGA